MAKPAQDWIATNCSEFTSKDQWTLNSSNLSPLKSGLHVWGAMPECHISTLANRTSTSSRKFCSRCGTRYHRTRSNVQLPKLTLKCPPLASTQAQTYAEMNQLSDFSIRNNIHCFLTMKITSCY